MIQILTKKPRLKFQIISIKLSSKIILFYSLFAILTLAFACSKLNTSKNNLEIVLDRIEDKSNKAQVMEVLGDSVKIDWNNPIKYESDCEEYRVLIQNDTFLYKYYLDFCYGKFNWWNKYEK